jgi:hypothetical protein
VILQYISIDEKKTDILMKPLSKIVFILEGQAGTCGDNSLG